MTYPITIDGTPMVYSLGYGFRMLDGNGHAIPHGGKVWVGEQLTLQATRRSIEAEPVYDWRIDRVVVKSQIVRGETDPLNDLLLSEIIREGPPQFIVGSYEYAMDSFTFSLSVDDLYPPQYRDALLALKDDPRLKMWLKPVISAHRVMGDEELVYIYPTIIWGPKVNLGSEIPGPGGRPSSLPALYYLPVRSVT